MRRRSLVLNHDHDRVYSPNLIEKLPDNSEMGSLWPLEGAQNGAGNTVSVPSVLPEAGAQGCQSDLSDSLFKHSAK